MVGDIDCRGLTFFDKRFVEKVEDYAFECGTVDLNLIEFLWEDKRVYFDELTGDPYTTRKDIEDAIGIFTDLPRDFLDNF